MKLGSWRGICLAVASMVFASSFVACPLLKKKGGADAGDDPSASLADAATVAAAGLGAKNEANVLRYANETPLPNEAAVIGDGGAHARNFPGNGPEVAFLPKGTPVAKIAQYFSTATLVMFDDPSGDGSKLMGWVPPKAFDVAAPAPTKVIVPPPVIKTDGGSNVVAVKDAGAITHDAGAVTVKDAGAPAVVDAGGGGGGSNSAIPQPAKGVLAVPPVNGKCPDGWAVAESMCRRKCTADAECPRNTKCAVKQGTKVCTSDH
jgi:WAP-type (Whey Acidic Protein) 'four-disulfide core'